MAAALGFVGGLFGFGAGAAFASGAAAFGGWVAGAAFGGTFLGGIAVKLLTTVAVSALSQALTPDPPQGGGITISATVHGEDKPETIILGRYATGGQAVAAPYSHGKSNRYLTHVIELCSAPGAKLERIMVGDGWAELGETPHGEFGYPVLGEYDGHVWVKYYDGTQTAVDQMMHDRYGNHGERPWTADMIGTGICYAILTFRYDQEDLPQVPRYRFELSGIPLYDIRKDDTAGGSGSHRLNNQATWEHTENAAVIAWNIMRGIPLPGGDVWGGNITDLRALPTSVWIAAMNRCDAPAELEGGETEPAYRAGIEVALDQPPAAALEEIFKACSGTIADLGYGWGLTVGAPALPVYSFTDDDIIVSRTQEMDPFPAIQDTYNAVSAKYPDPEHLWETKDAPQRTDATLEAADAFGRRSANLSLPAAPYAMQVQRLMLAWLNDERRFRRHVISLPPDSAHVELIDTINWSSERNGYAGKDFSLYEVLEDPRTGIRQLSIRERDPADYSWQPSFALPSAPVAALPTPVLPEAVLGFGAESVILEDADGIGRRPGIRLSWDSEIIAAGLRWEIRQDGEVIASLSGNTVDLTLGEKFVYGGILPSTRYFVRGRLVKSRPTEWTGWYEVTTGDIRLGARDIAQEILDTLQNAFDAATAAAEDAEAAEAAAAAAQTYTDDAVDQARSDLAVDFAAAQAAAADALAHADEAESWSLTTEANAARLFPADFRDGARFWRHTAAGSPLDATDLAPSAELLVDPTIGPFMRLGAAAAINQNVLSRGVAEYEADRTIRIKVNARPVGGTTTKLRTIIAVLKADFTVNRYIAVGTVTTTTADTWATSTTQLTLPAAQAGDVWFRAGVYAVESVTPDLTCDVSMIRIEDVTLLKATDDLRAAAQIARDDAVAAKTTAEGAASAAQTSQTLAATSAAAAGQSKTDAENSASAAATSATTAATQATDAGSSAYAADQSRIAAETARNGAQSASASAGIARDAAVTARQNAETAAAGAQESLELTAEVSGRGTSVINDAFLASSGWERIGGAQGNLTQTANAVYPIGRTWDFNVTAAQTDGMMIWNSPASIWPGQTNATAYVVEVEFSAISGTLGGAGVRLTWNNTAGGIFDVSVPLSTMQAGGGAAGRTRLAQAVFIRPASFTGTFEAHRLFIYANYSGSGWTMAAKQIQIHRVNIRPATQEEMGQGQVMASVQAHLTQNYFTQAQTGLAIANADLTLNASLDGTFASVAQNSTALASLDGTVARFSNVVTVNGEQRAGIEAVAFDGNGAGSGSAIRLIGDHVIAEGTLSGREVVIHDGSGNLFPDPQFSRLSLTGWRSGTSPANAIVPMAQADITEWPIKSNCPAASVLYVANHNGQGYASITSPEFQVAAGDTYVLSFDYAVSGAATHPLIFAIGWIDRNGAWIQRSGITKTTAPTTWNSSSLAVTAPVGAIAGRIEIVSVDNGSINAWACATNFSVIKQRSAATLITPFSVTTSLLAANCVTADKALFNDLASLGLTVGTADIDNAAINGAKIGTLAVDTLHLKDGSVTKFGEAENQTGVSTNNTSTPVTIVGYTWSSPARHLFAANGRYRCVASTGGADTVYVKIFVDGVVAASFSHMVDSTTSEDGVWRSFDIPVRWVESAGSHAVSVSFTTGGLHAKMAAEVSTVRWVK